MGRWRWRRGGTRRLEACARPADPTPFSLSPLSFQHVDTLAGATFVNEYVVVGGLGRGAHGAVRAAVDTRRGALVALKVAPRVGRGDKAAALAAGGRDRGARGPVVGAAAREAALLRGLAAARCPGIVRLLELVDDPRRDRLLLIMEYCERGAVGSAAAPARASAAKAWRVAAGVAAALAGMHALGVAHGDVKPDNILERGDGSVVLADLGAARAAFPATAPTTPLAATLPARRAGGTPAFAPRKIAAATVVARPARRPTCGRSACRSSTSRAAPPRSPARPRWICATPFGRACRGRWRRGAGSWAGSRRGASFLRSSQRV